MRGYGKHILLSIVALIVVFLALIVKPIIPFAQAQNGNSNNQDVFTLDSQPYGVSYAEWTAKFWQWLLEQPSDNNPSMIRQARIVLITKKTLMCGSYRVLLEAQPNGHVPYLLERRFSYH